jgi:hypothetical protein
VVQEIFAQPLGSLRFSYEPVASQLQAQFKYPNSVRGSTKNKRVSKYCPSGGWKGAHFNRSSKNMTVARVHGFYFCIDLG